MRRHEAKNLVYENHYTAGQLLTHLEMNMDLADDKTSRLNKELTRGQVWTILYRAVSEHPPDFRFDSGHRSRVLIAANVIREFGVPLENEKEPT
jgi:hypothetical protein